MPKKWQSNLPVENHNERTLKSIPQLDWRGKLVAAIMGVQQLTPGKGNEVNFTLRI